MNAKVIIEEVRKNINSSVWLTSTNLEIEGEKVLKNYNYNPKLTYPPFPRKKIEDYLSTLEKIKTDESGASEAYFAKRSVEELILKLQLILARGTSRFGEISQNLYLCDFDENTLTSAKKDSEIKEVFGQKDDLTPSQAADKIDKYLKKIGINDWTVQLTSEVSFYFRIKQEDKLILIGKVMNWDFCDLDNTIAHEIDGHVVRAVNAQKQILGLFQKPLPFYIKTEEGLASFLGDYLSTTTEISLKHHALKYLAGHRAVNGTFSEVFNFLLESGFTPKLALQRTFRLKRGLEDTSKPGCFAKEAVYYEGMLEVKKYIDTGGNLNKLYSGKIGLADLNLIPVSDNILIPERLTKYKAKGL